MSGMVICTSGDGQALVKDDTDSDTAWVEGAVLLLKHKDGQFTWQSGANCKLVEQSKTGSFSRIILITPETVTACHDDDELYGVRYTFNNGDLDTKWGLLNLFERD